MYKNKISAVYKIVNTVTGNFYIGSSKNVKQRWTMHRAQSSWKAQPNNKMYQDMQKYGLECFSFEILEEVETQYLKQVEQKFIELLNPTYNDRNSKGWDVERYKESHRKASKKYYKSEKGKVARNKYTKKYFSQLCEYNGETLTLNTLSARFLRAGISHPVLEAKKYLV